MTHTQGMQLHIIASARLHFGFLDLHGGLGRRFGSLGVSIDEIGTELTARRADELTASGPGAERALRFAREFIAATGLPEGLRLEIRRTIPEHAGLGSGTQMALAVGTALCRLHGLPHRTEEIAALLHRGQRSGVGIGLFSSGGVVVDAGHGPGTLTPPIVSRIPVPEAWRFLVIIDPGRQGLSGNAERAAFSRLQAMSEAAAGEICRIVLMQVLPGLAEADCVAFGSGVTRIQEIVGSCFAEEQHGPFGSPDVQQALLRLREMGAAGMGQSSWGPTGFAIFGSETGAHQALRELRAGYADGSPLDFVLCRARNLPAEVRVAAARASKSSHR